jgi:hypothetical protein
VGQRLQTVRQFILVRNGRAIDENRDDTNVPLESGFDFNTQIVVWIFYTPSIMLVGNGKPFLAYDRNKDGALSDMLRQNLYEIDARGMLSMSIKTFSCPKWLIKRSPIRPANPGESLRL